MSQLNDRVLGRAVGRKIGLSHSSVDRRHAVHAPSPPPRQHGLARARHHEKRPVHVHFEDAAPLRKTEIGQTSSSDNGGRVNRGRERMFAGLRALDRAHGCGRIARVPFDRGEITAAPSPSRLRRASARASPSSTSASPAPSMPRRPAVANPTPDAAPVKTTTSAGALLPLRCIQDSSDSLVVRIRTLAQRRELIRVMAKPNVSAGRGREVAQPRHRSKHAD
jgi:hypothetical protein